MNFITKNQKAIFNGPLHYLRKILYFSCWEFAKAFSLEAIGRYLISYFSSRWLDPRWSRSERNLQYTGVRFSVRIHGHEKYTASWRSRTPWFNHFDFSWKNFWVNYLRINFKRTLILSIFWSWKILNARFEFDIGRYLW